MEDGPTRFIGVVSILMAALGTTFRPLLRFLQIGCRFGLPFIVAVLFGLVTFDHFRPWSLANELVPYRAGQTRLLIGASYSSHATYAAPENAIERSADYIYYPEALRTRETYRLKVTSGEGPTLSIIVFSPISYVVSLFAVLALSAMAWWLPLTKRA